MKQGDETNQNSRALQGETVAMRVQENQNITSALNESKQKLLTLDSQNQKKDAIRAKLFEMQGKLRNLEVTIENELVTNHNLKNVKTIEEQLRNQRDVEEKDQLEIARVTQNDSIKWGRENQYFINDQD